MLSHPIIDALLNVNSCDPSKQLISVRERLTSSSDYPSILLVLPPAADISQEIDSDLLFRDNFLLSHVFDISDSKGNEIYSLNGSSWSINLRRNEVIASDGFPDAGKNTAMIVNRIVWSPGLKHLSFNATFLVLEVDRLLVRKEAVKRFSWFGIGKSTPRYADENNSKTLEDVADPKPVSSITPVTRLDETPYRRPLNPARELGRTVSQREHNMAKVDYFLACLQGDVVNSAESARRFHEAVANVIKSLSEAGGVFITEDTSENEGEERQLEPTEFTLASVYKYAEYRLSRQSSGKLDELLESERGERSFFELHEQLKYLDIGQVDIPGLAGVDIAAFERAVLDASLILDRSAQARNAHDMCQIFLQALNTLADPKLGTVSADTLLGLFMLTVLRTSEACAKVFERDLYFVLHFSFQTSDSPAARASAGRLSYTSMVVESVLMQLRMEYHRLVKIASSNKRVWEAIRADERPILKTIAISSPTSLSSRHRGKSVSFMTVEDDNSTSSKYLFQEFSSLFTTEFVIKDKDLKSMTLVMKAAQINVSLAKVVIDYLNEEDNLAQLEGYLRAKNLKGRSVAYYIRDLSEFPDEIVRCSDYTSKDENQMTAITYHALHQNLKPFFPVLDNFFDHLDKFENSLSHISIHDASIVQTLLENPSCDVNWSNRSGKVAIQSAQKELEVVDLSLQKGADPWIPYFVNEPQFLVKMVRSVRSYPFVVRISDLDEYEILLEDDGQVRKIQKTLDSFKEFRQGLVKEYPASWVPSLPEVRQDYTEKTILFSMFSHISKSQEDIKLSIWLSFSKNHATLGESKSLEEFLQYTPSQDSVNNTSPEQTTSFSKDSQKNEIIEITEGSKEILSSSQQTSILAFLDLAQDQSRSISAAIGEMVRYMARSEDLYLCTVRDTTKVERGSAIGLAPLLRTGFRTTQCESTRHLHGSHLPGIIRSSFTQLIEQARSMESKLQYPTLLAEQSEKERSEYRENRDKSRQLAEAKSKPLWSASSENRRVAEIDDLERRVTSGRLEIKSLESFIVKSHYFLASELSTFNSHHEEELSAQIKNYSFNQVQSAKDRLKRLQFGYKIEDKA